MKVVSPIGYTQRPELAAVLELIARPARQLKPIEKLMMKLTTKSQIEFGLPDIS